MTARIVAIVAALGCLSTAAAQGRTDYFNVETPVGQALAVARIANHDYLLVCNTPDNSVEVYDTDESGTGLPLLARIPVGMEPNSILWDASRSRAYVTCFLNDSLDSFTLSAPTGPASLTYGIDQSRNLGFDPGIPSTDPQPNLGDEPMDMALARNNSVLLVSFGSKSAIGAFNPVTLEPIAADLAFPAPSENILLQAPIGAPAVQAAIKEPRTIEVFGDKLFVLNHKGGIAGTNPFGVQDYDFDLYSRDVSTTASAGTVVPLGNLGSTNWNMRFTSAGDLYVVGGLARIDLIGGPAVANATTGFVESKLYRVTGAGTAGATVIERDLNVVFSGMFAMVVPKSQALAMPTDLVVLEGSPAKVFVAAFGSDRVGVITLVNPALPKTWTIARIAIPLAPLSTNPRTGPRSLVLKTATGGGLPDPGDRVYVLNRMDHSVSIINPQNNAVETFALGQGYDPTPAHIRNGREFLYSADLSNSGFVSCASCHGDGRTDSLGWNLGSPTGFSAPFPASFIDSPSGADLADVEDLLANGFDPDKGMLITQTLQGLLDTEVAPEVQDLVTNAPYHWRGDRARFTDFNEAFANLLGLGCQFGPCGPGDLPMGIDPADMEDFEEFVNSIHYPPNPKELETRLFEGDLGDADVVGVADTIAGGSDALRGMKIFHIRPLGGNLNGRSCVQCHALPRGSNLKYTDSRTPPLETAQVRGLFQRELRFEVDGNDIVASDSPLAGMFGLSHAGGRGTINTFNNLFGLPDEDHKDLNQFIHQFDWGVAPIVGRVQRVVVGNAGSQLVDDRLDLFEAQAGLGNCGLAARGQVGSGSIGYWYDPTQGLYVQESTGANPISRLTLLGMVTGSRHRIFFRCTPLGSERRVAAVTGASASLGGSAPSSLDLLALAPIAAWSLVPTMDVNWIPVAQGGTFAWTHPTMRTPRFLRAIRRFQYGLIDPNNQSNYGLPALRHDAARRFRVAGNNILPGAKLVIWTPNDTSGAPPDTNANPPDPAKTRRLEFPLYATSATDAGRPIWETAAELAPIQYFALMNGGIEAPGVQATLDDWQSLGGDILPSGTFNPDQFNWHFVQVINPDGGTGSAGWERLNVQ